MADVDPVIAQAVSELKQTIRIELNQATNLAAAELQVKTRADIAQYMSNRDVKRVEASLQKPPEWFSQMTDTENRLKAVQRQIEANSARYLEIVKDVSKSPGFRKEVSAAAARFLKKALTKVAAE